MDKFRRVVFTISAEGATLFEWSIWSSLLTYLIGLPLTIALLQSIIKGFFVVFTTGLVMFAISFIILFITDEILKLWPFEISDDELEFEENYIPRIPNDQ